MYAPVGHPFFWGAIWSSIFVIPVILPLTYLWAKTRHWPLKFIKQTLQEMAATMQGSADQHQQNSETIIKQLADLQTMHNDLQTRLDRHDNEFEALKAKLDAQSPASPEQ